MSGQLKAFSLYPNRYTLSIKSFFFYPLCSIINSVIGVAPYPVVERNVLEIFPHIGRSLLKKKLFQEFLISLLPSIKKGVIKTINSDTLLFALSFSMPIWNLFVDEGGHQNKKRSVN